MAFLAKGRQRSAGPAANYARLGGRVGGSFTSNRAFGPDIAQIPGTYPQSASGGFLPMFLGGFN